MKIIYSWMEKKIPVGQILKCRKNGDFEIVYGNALEICYLNKTSSIILHLCDGNHSIGDIKEYLLNKFDADENALENDLVDIIRDLQWKRLVVLEG